MACAIDDREGVSPSPRNPGWGRRSHGSATGRRRFDTLVVVLNTCQASQRTRHKSDLSHGWHRTQRPGQRPDPIDGSVQSVRRPTPAPGAPERAACWQPKRGESAKRCHPAGVIGRVGARSDLAELVSGPQCAVERVVD
jgi:hypothetical protein